MADQYLDYRAIAERMGVSVPVLRKYLAISRRNRENGTPSFSDMPEPDHMFGRTPVWKPTTIDRWIKRRPGKGVGGAEARERYKREREVSGNTPQNN